MTKENNPLGKSNTSQKSGKKIQTFTHRCPIDKPKSSTASSQKENKSKG